MLHIYGVCCVPFLFGNPFVKSAFFKSLPKKRSDCESQKTGFGSDLKNPPRVRILWIHDPFLVSPQKTQNPFVDSEILICIFPTSLTGFLVTSRSVNVSVFDWLIRKQETFYSLIHGFWWGAGQAGESGGSLQSVVWVPFFFGNNNILA